MGQGAELKGKRILLGVTGSIAAYKAAEILRRLQDQGAEVQVVTTRNAERFVSRLTFETLSGRSVPGAEFQDWDRPGIGHIDLTAGLDLALVAPATANILGKLASGIADDTLTTALLALDCPLLIAPAMNDRMYAHPAVRRNMVILQERGVRFIEPGTGRLACGVVGPGRLADIELILSAVARLAAPGDLAGTKVVVTAGPTREPIDAVRYISNPSTGKMGFALAAAARARGADVSLISGPTCLTPPPGAQFMPVTTAAEMAQAVLEQMASCQILIMAAAVSDFRPAAPSDRKIKKQTAPSDLKLERTEDILLTVSRQSKRPFLVGFAAETDELEENARKKLAEKQLDMIVANSLLQPDRGFGSDTNSVLLIARDGTARELPSMDKRVIADRILDKAVELWKR